MPEKDFIIWLDDATYLKVEFTTARGRVVSFVVRLMRVVGNRVFNVVRYDTAHGLPHRDILDRRGRVIRKDWLTDRTFEQALSHAKDDLRFNYETCVRQFEASSHTSPAQG